MSGTATYNASRGRLEAYFDRTAFDAWKALTSDAPVSKIRATVRAGRDRMRGLLLDWLPADLTGKRLLDAGCGTGALAVEAARRGAQVVAVDVSAQLVAIAQGRTPAGLGGQIDYRVGDMLDAAHGDFDHIVAMDSLIHYTTPDIVAVLHALAARTAGSMVFTVTPRTLPLMLMLGMGKAFPRSDRAPAIIPADIAALRPRLVAANPGWTAPRTTRVSGGFYTSQAIELCNMNPDGRG